MGRFDFKSPGAAFVDTMTQVLAERKAEERQRMLDDLTRQAEARADLDSQSNRLAREQQIAANKAAERRAAIEAYRAPLSPDIDPTSIYAPDSEAIKLLREGGWLAPGGQSPTPGVSTTESFEMPEDIPEVGGTQLGEPITSETTTQAPSVPSQQWRYVGTPEQRKEHERKLAEESMLAEIMQNPNNPEAGKLVGRMIKAGYNPPAEFLSRLLAGESPIVYDEASGKFIPQDIKIRPGQPVVERSRPPIGPAPWRETGEVDSNGRQVLINQLTGETKLGDTVVSRGDTASLGVANNLLVEHSNNIRVIRADIEGGVVPTPSNIQAAKDTALYVIENAKGIDPEARMLARLYVENPEKLKNLIRTRQRIGTEPSEKVQLQFGRLKAMAVPDDIAKFFVPAGYNPGSEFTVR